jgi:hypothetical protein
MIIKTSGHPGSHERHLLRKAGNPLFADAIELNDDTLLAAQQRDHEELTAFHAEFRSLLEATTAMAGNVDSEVILQLKDRLDQTYELAATVAEDQSKAKEAIHKLLRYIMAAVRQGAGSDFQAHQELDQEEAAREAHFTLLESKLVADLLNPHSPIHTDELIPTLLSSSKDELQLALQIFDEMQLLMVLSEGAKLLEQLQDNGVNADDAQQKLAFMQGYAEFAGEMGKL